MLHQVLCLVSCILGASTDVSTANVDYIEFSHYKIVGNLPKKERIVTKCDKNFDLTLTGITPVEKDRFIIIVIDDVLNDAEFNFCEEPLDVSVPYTINMEEDNWDIVTEELKDSEEV